MTCRNCACLAGSFSAIRLGGRPTLEGREDQFAASGSSRWLNIVVDLLASLRILPPSNVKFRGTTDSRLKN
jgi:hypothetical protein